MTVATTNITSGPYIGTGAGDEFAYDFRVDDKTQLSVWETTAAGVKTLLVVDTDYTVAGVGVDGGGQITRVAGNLPTNYIWYIRSNYADTQSTSFGSQGGFFPDVHEAAFDKRTFVSQQQDDEFRRSIKLDNSDESAESADMTIPVVATRASQYLGFDVDGNLITIAGTAGAVTVSSFMETLLDDNDIETALGTLGLSIGADAASAGTLALGVGNYFDITGTTTIVAIGTKFVGAQVILQFDGILTFTHHATDLILPGGENITTKVGTLMSLVEYETGKWVYVSGDIAQNIALGSDADGDIYYRDAGILKRLAKGTDEDFLSLKSGIPSWQKKPSFSVHKNGTNQTAIPASTYTKVTWSTEEFDTNNDFDSDRFTPTVAGKYQLSACCQWWGMASGRSTDIAIYKNGTLYKEVRGKAAGSTAANVGPLISFPVNANGTTDYFEIYVYHTNTIDGSLGGNSSSTYFGGSKIA